MYGTYIPNQYFNALRISVFRDITKIWKKFTHIQKVKNIYLNIIIIILKSYQYNGKHNYSSINNPVTYPFFISNEFIDFSESMKKFSVFLRFSKYRLWKTIEIITVQLLV